jgi:radical SAM protein with 4Fe4S-binding SPASM domain
MIHATPNANFYSLGVNSVHDNGSSEYQEYRKAWMELPANFQLRDFPMHLDIESTSRCNLKCTFCDKLPLMQRNQLGDIDFDLYKKIIDEGSEHRLWGVKLSYRGEPLLHKKIVEMVEYAVRRNVLDVYFNTNGMLLTEAMAQRLIDAGLTRISVSVEGIDPVAFEKERIGAKFDTILHNISTLIDLRERAGSVYPKVRVQTVRFPDLDLDQYTNYWSTRCDEVAAVDYKDESCRVKELRHDWGCPQLWQRMTIEWDGSVFPCNNDDLRTLSPGNAHTRTIYDCWHDKQVQAVRELHRQGQTHMVKDCDGCPWRTAQINKINEAITL